MSLPHSQNHDPRAREEVEDPLAQSCPQKGILAVATTCAPVRYPAVQVMIDG